MPPQKLKLNGKPFILHKESERAIRIRAALDASPADEIYTADELERLHGLKGVSDCNRLVADVYHLKVGATRYWGNPKAIVALRAQVNL